MSLLRRLMAAPVYPFLTATAWVIVSAHVAVALSDFVRPTVLIWVVMAGLIALLRMRLGIHRAALVVTGVALLLTPQAGSMGTLVLFIGGLAILTFAAHIGHPVRVGPKLTATLNLAAAIALVLVGTAYLWTHPQFEGHVAGPCPAGIHSGPDMYVFLLDGYASEATQQRLFGASSDPFLHGLEERGFWVDRSSHTTYPATNLVVPSVLNMERLQDDQALSDEVAGFTSELTQAIKHSRAADLLRCAGYETVATAMPYRDIELSSADRYLAHGEISNFEIDLIQSTRLTALLDMIAPGFVYAQHRERLELALADTAAVSAEPTTRPRFVWTHLISPHPPFVYTPDGVVPDEPTPARNLGNTPDETPGGVDSEWYTKRYMGNVRHIGTSALDTISQIIANDPDAVIVVFSDHGSNMGYDPADTSDRNDYAERYGNLFAVRAPGIDASELYDSPVVPLNILGPLFDHYIGADIAPGPTDAYGRPHVGPDGKLVFPEVDPHATPTP